MNGLQPGLGPIPLPDDHGSSCQRCYLVLGLLRSFATKSEVPTEEVLRPNPKLTFPANALMATRVMVFELVPLSQVR